MVGKAVHVLQHLLLYCEDKIKLRHTPSMQQGNDLANCTKTMGWHPITLKLLQLYPDEANVYEVW